MNPEGSQIRRAIGIEEIIVRQDGTIDPLDMIDPLARTLLKENEELRLDVERLNRMVRETGQGQGAIDAYVAQCEDIDRLREELRLAKLAAIGCEDVPDFPLVVLRICKDRADALRALADIRDRLDIAKDAEFEPPDYAGFMRAHSKEKPP